MFYTVSVTHTFPVNSKHMLGCRDRSGKNDTVNNINIVRSYRWSMLTVYRGPWYIPCYSSKYRGKKYLAVPSHVRHTVPDVKRWVMRPGVGRLMLIQSRCHGLSLRTV